MKHVFFQRHRCSEKWKWIEEGKKVDFQLKKIKNGDTKKKVILALSLSGKVKIDNFAYVKGENLNVFELSLKGMLPNPMFLENELTLIAFKKIYRSFLSKINSEFPDVEEIIVLPAVPAPIAVLLGRELLKKVDPLLSIYDFNKNRNKFTYALGVNQ